MDSKKIGITLMVFAVVLFGMVYSFLDEANNVSAEKNCNPSKECQKAASVIGWSHLAFGLIFSVLSLGFYILFFNNDLQVLERIEKETQKIFDLLTATGDNGIELASPYEPLAAKKRSLFYRNILIKIKCGKNLSGSPFFSVIGGLRKGWTVDVDPISTV